MIDFKCVKTNKNITNNKIIWMYWGQGIDNAPELVKIAFKNWSVMNRNYDVLFLDDRNLHEYLGFDFNKLWYDCEHLNLGMAGKSDFLRILLLYHYGGTWVDSTTFCLSPLDSWMEDKWDFFVFRQPKKVVDRQLVSWFMYSKPHSKEITMLLESMVYYLFTFLNNKGAFEVKGIAETFSCSGYIKRKLIKRLYISRKGTGFKFLRYCRDKGIIPYFWMFYIWNDICKKHPIINEKLNSLPNDYCQPRDDIETFIKSKVSKQSHWDLRYIKNNNDRIEIIQSNINANI